MSDTPRTDAFFGPRWPNHAHWDDARTLCATIEREFRAAHRAYDDLKALAVENADKLNATRRQRTERGMSDWPGRDDATRGA